MSTYNHPRPGVSRYIANLNTIPSSAELAAQNEFELASDGLDFLNTEFFDFDASAFNPHGEFAHPTAAPQHAPQPAAPGNTENFQYAEFQGFPQPPQFSQSPTSMTQSPSAIPYPADFATGDKRDAAAAQLQPIGDLEESSRHAAEEDKRRRNTAASARFRVKKKQREAALEKQAKEMTDKVSALESKVQQLEMENKWLKGLITEKSDTKGMEEKFQKFIKEKQVESEADKRNDGVGTKAGVQA